METERETENNTHFKQILEEVNHGDGPSIVVVEDSPDFSPPSPASYSSLSSFGEYPDNEKGLDLNFQSDGSSPPFVNDGSSPPYQNDESSQLDSTLSSHWNMLRNLSQKKFQPPQTMGQPEEYDPSRIPTSIFTSKPSNPTDWSVASNESLFSIHMGNTSFSRDHPFFAKSGELPRLEDWCNSQSNWSSPQSNLPPVLEISAHGDHENEDFNKSPTFIPEASKDNHVKEKIAPPEVNPAPVLNLPRLKVASPERFLASPERSLSAGSGNSCSSFAFPVLVNEGAKSPSSLKVVIEKPEKPEPESLQAPPVATPKASGKKWFSCFWGSKCC